jgi:inner membrane protein
MALVIASNAPDADFISVAGGAVKYLEWHRGMTHGVIGVVGLGLATAVLVRTGLRLRDRAGGEPHASFKSLWLAAMLGIVFHIIMDLPTSYGTRLLSPFDWHWFAKDWLPILDVYLLTILIAGLRFGRQPAGRARPVSTAAVWHARERSAAVALMFVAMNYGLRATAHHEALMQAPRLFGPLLPPACPDATPPGRLIDRWPVDAPPVREEAVTLEPGPARCLMEIAAIPSFLSPFRWRVIARLSDAYELHDIDVLSGWFGDQQTTADGFWRRSRRYPNVWTPAVLQAASARTAQVFLGFSRFPAARFSVDREGNTVVRWTDVRFASGEVGGRQIRGRDLFTVTIRASADGRIQDQKFGP